MDLSQKGIDETLCDPYLQVLKSRLHHMMRTGDYSDITFVVEGESFKCHKNILASACLYFDTMFKSQITGMETNLIEIKTTPRDIFQAIINFIYTGELTFCEDNAQHLLEASDLMQFDELKHICCQFFIKEMDPSNCFGIWQLSCAVNAPHLQKQAFIFTCENFPEASSIDNEEFLNLDHSLLKSLLTYPHINSPSEDFIVEKSLVWLEYSPCDRMETFVDILHNIALYTVSLQCLQYTLLDNISVRCASDLAEYIQDIVKHKVLLGPLPATLNTGFPRTRTEFVEGLVVLSRESLNKSSSHSNIRMKLSYYRFEHENSLSVAKSEDLPIDFELNDYTTLCSVDTNLYVCNSAGMHKYDMPMQQWTQCNKWGVAARHKILLCQGRRLFNLEYSHYRCPVYEYSFAENKWDKIGALKKKLVTADFAMLEYKGAIYIFGGNKGEPDLVQAFDIHTKTGYVLNIKLPRKLSGLQCLQYKGQAIVAGDENTCIYRLEELQQELSGAKHLAELNSPTTTDPPMQMTITHNHSHPMDIADTQTKALKNQPERPFYLSTESDDVNSSCVNVVIKSGMKRYNYCIERLGNQLLILAGNSHHPKFCKEVEVTDIEHLLQDGILDKWRTVAMLSDELNRYNISLYKSAVVMFKH